jgi:hypothetical protein
LFDLLVGANSCRNAGRWECGKLPRGNLSNPKGAAGSPFVSRRAVTICLDSRAGNVDEDASRMRQFVAMAPGIFLSKIKPLHDPTSVSWAHSKTGGDMNNNLQVQQEEGDEFPALLIGTGLVLASLILVPALAQRVGLGASVTIALRGVLMRAANRA